MESSPKMSSALEDLPRVLLIHDGADVRKRVQHDVKGLFDLSIAASARTALTAIDRIAPAVIFCEANLLCGDDCELLRALRSRACCATTPIVVLSAADAEAARTSALAAGADDFLREPFGAPELQARVNAHLRAVQIRQKVAGEFREKEERLRAALTASGAGAFRWDVRNNIVQWDESLDRLVGFPPGETIGSFEAYLSMIHPDDLPEFVDRSDRCLQEGVDFEMEYRLRRPDGATRWVYDRAKAYFDKQQRPLYVTGAILDVTERKLSELRQLFLAQLDESLRPLVDAAEITSTAARVLGEHLGADRCAYAHVSEDGEMFDVYGDFHRGVPSMVGQYPVGAFGEDVLAAMQADKPYVFNDVNTITPPRKDLSPYEVAQIQAGVSVPLHKNGRLVGGMAVHQATSRQWTAEEVELVQIVCNRCWESMERARVTRNLQESEAKYRQLADSIPMIVWEGRADGTIDYYNRRWYEYTGLKPGTLGDEAWLPFVHADDIQNIAEAWTLAMQSGSAFAMQLRIKEHRTGEYRWFLARAVPTKDSQGCVLRWFGTSTDVHDAKLMEHALRANEERLRAIIEATPECVTVVSRDGALLQMNRSGLEMIGAASEDAVRGLSALELLVPEHRQRWLENHERVCSGENLHWEFEIVGFDGARRWMETHGVPVTMPDGERAHLSVTRDVTDRKRTEVEREHSLAAERAARAEAEQTGRIKDEFLATLSHELRTPLNAILGYATLMQMSEMDEAQLSEAIATIERNARLQAQLIEDLLDMNRIISGKIRLDVQSMDLPEVVGAAIDTVRPSADAKLIRLKALIDPLAGPVRGDPGRIQQVVWNLLSNAIKFTPKGGSVHVAVERVNSHIEIRVADTGEGIAPEFLPHVFDRFRQADSSTTRKYGGLGLGLSIARHLVELHGGAVRATSPGKGHGATFVVALPLSALHTADDPARREHPSTPTSSQEPSMIDLSGVEVLAVDDELDACVLVKRVLEGCSAKVETATTAREALQLLQERKFDVLVSDIGMPVEDGYDLMRAVRALEGTPRQVRAVALTAFARSEDRRRAALAGFHTHVSKPVEAGELIAIVANLAGRTGM